MPSHWSPSALTIKAANAVRQTMLACSDGGAGWGSPPDEIDTRWVSPADGGVVKGTLIRARVIVFGSLGPARVGGLDSLYAARARWGVTFWPVASSNPKEWRTPPDPSPADLARAAAGEHDAFRLIVERYQSMVYSVAYNLLGAHVDAEDAAQEVFLRCYRTLPQYRRESSFSTWLFRLGEGVDARTLVDALAELPDDYRTPTVLRDVYGLPYQEIADLTARPLGTVKVMVHRGRAALRLRLRAGGVRGDA